MSIRKDAPPIVGAAPAPAGGRIARIPAAGIPYISLRSMVPRDTCYYDGQCGLCRRTTRILRAADIFGRLDFADMLAVPEATLPVTLADAMTGMPMRTRDGRSLLGFPAVRRAAAQTLLAPLAWLLNIPGLSHIGAWAYKRIASNRARECALPAGTPQRILRP